MSLLRGILGKAGSGASAGEVEKWAAERGFRTGTGSKNALGPQIAATTAGVNWKMEWGSPSRDYIPNIELRVRAETPSEFRPYGLLASRRLWENPGL